MKALNDEELQSLLEGGLYPVEELVNADEKKTLEQYQLLFETLKEAPKEGLPYSFAATVKNRLQIQLYRKRDAKFCLFALMILSLCFVLFYGLLCLVNIDSANQFIRVVLNFKWVLITGTLVFVSILYLDQRLVKTASLNKR